MQTTKTIDFESSIAPWLGKTVKIVEYYLHEAFDKHQIDLTKEQMIVLKKLHDEDGLVQNELAFLTLRNKSSLTRLLVKMEAKNLIYRQQGLLDKRVNHVFLTDHGKEVYRKTRPIIKEIMTQMEMGISEDDIAYLITLLKRIQTNFNTTTPQI